MDWFIKISLVNTTEILVMRRVSWRWLQNARDSHEMRETWQVCE